MLPPQECSGVVPLSLGLRIGRLCCDRTVDLLLPGWRARMRPYLPTLAPAHLSVLELAEATGLALQHAAELERDAQGVLDGVESVASWLRRVPTALSAIAFGPHKGLIRLVLRVLAAAPALEAGSMAGEGGSELQPAAVGEEEALDATGCLLVLLQHPVDAVVAQTWQCLQRLVRDEDSGSPSSAACGLLRLLCLRAVMRHLVVLCATCEDSERLQMVADVLGAALSSSDFEVVTGAHVPFTNRSVVAPRIAARPSNSCGRAQAMGHAPSSVFAMLHLSGNPAAQECCNGRRGWSASTATLYLAGYVRSQSASCTTTRLAAPLPRRRRGRSRASSCSACTTKPAVCAMQPPSAWSCRWRAAQACCKRQLSRVRAAYAFDPLHR